MEGTLELREQIANKLEVCYQRRFDPSTEITVTCGGTEALYDAIQSAVGRAMRRSFSIPLRFL